VSGERRFHAQPAGSVRGVVRVPGDKSVSHRFVMLASLAQGPSQAEGFLEGEDALATVAAFRAMGVRIEGPSDGHIRIHGAGLHGLREPDGDLDMGNSGTAMRLLAGLLSGQRFATRLVGDDSLTRRPMRRVTEPLTRMGARIRTSARGTPPLAIEPAAGGLHGIDFEMPVASAQVKSCVLLAGLYADSPVRVTEPAPTRDHTERMLASFGRPLELGAGCIRMLPGGELGGQQVVIPGDISSAAFLLVAASIVPGSQLSIEGVGVNPSRTGVLQILRLMGPVLMVAAACAEGETELTGAAELRVKESDRISAVATGLRALGVAVEEREDGMRVHGGRLGPGVVDSQGDHRIAMAFAVAGAAASGPVEVLDCANVDTSFPGFAALAQTAGMGIRVA
jgi:3-phosphoshikimate 1-carboxyvinyltransferase